ncbi:MAG TPA: saccharopine dehydrogenase, partial [Saprospiraceae bacterium]|nr:saccharopine dehydrogenase [Saprospiraceae bacterium]
MKNILIIGAGRSASTLIDYLLKQAKKYEWNVTVADADLALAEAKTANCELARAMKLDIFDVEARQALISEVEVVVSMLPAFLHTEVAKDCVAFGKHLMTASYVSAEMAELGDKARAKGLVFMGEIGLDPGLDHMSAMQKIDEIKESG